MNKPQSNIRRMKPMLMGVCGICDKPTRLVGEDTVTPLKAGLCYLELLVFTDHMLTYHGPDAGIMHPPALIP